MKRTLQIEVLSFDYYCAVYGPYSQVINKIYKTYGRGYYDPAYRCWILPKNTGKAVLAKIFGEDSRSVITEITGANLVVYGRHLHNGGYLAAYWDRHRAQVWLPTGVELVSGSWDLAASAKSQTPCFTAPTAVLHIVVRHDYAVRQGLKIVEFLPENPIPYPYRRHADLIEELKRNGYLGERDIC